MQPLLTAEGGPLDQIAGLPVHPLLIHAVVILLPLSALALAAVVLVPRLRRYRTPAVVALAASAVGAFLAKESGEELAARVGMPAQHANYGSWLVWISIAAAVVAIGWWLLLRRGEAAGSAGTTAAASRSGATGQQGAGIGGGTATTTLAATDTEPVSTRATGPATLVGLLATGLALAAVVLTVLVGHSGATAVWKDRAGDASAPTAAGAASYALAEVAQHGAPGDCWVAVGDAVYDLTDWVAQHPGGPERITAICGTDATAAFAAQHAGQGAPESTLAGYRIGELAG